mmetsp:Transcript_18563/g.52500  ORF Transcript_18563/g.52500 Transcript_18563/m.52500 type:complete len:224 (-) Transcript_18563:143-814(-)
MGATSSAAGGWSATACTQPPTSQEEYRLPWALAQVDRFDSEDCPFCALRGSHCSWLQTEISRLASEVASLETAIPPKFLPDLARRLVELPLPDSTYTGGVDEIRGSACPRCPEHRRQVRRLQREARTLDAQCKARIKFHCRFARRIERLLIEKHRIEAQLYFKQFVASSGVDCSLGGQFCAITRVNQSDEDALFCSGVNIAPLSDEGLHAAAVQELPQEPETM